ncbi:MAG: NAD-dependent dehydratase, partial [Chloroflexi bacterium]|nr:NAD-dependent dehydratase [Chloroflexota bacterium]
MRVLFIGGTGNISAACVEESLARGHDVTVLNRGRVPLAFTRPVAAIVADRNDAASLATIARSQHFDVVADFIGMLPHQVQSAILAFTGQTGQYIYISSASAYQKPPS